MHDRPTLVERAFALAESGTCESLAMIRKQLRGEGYSDAGQLSGSSIRNQLVKLIAASKAKAVTD
jgi:hypothetical protein